MGHPAELKRLNSERKSFFQPTGNRRMPTTVKTTTKELLGDRAFSLHDLVIRLDDSNITGRGAEWARELYRSQNLCVICGRPFLATNVRSDVCCNTCTQKRKRGTSSPGAWFRVYTRITEGPYPHTVAELQDHPQRHRITKLPFDVIGFGDTPAVIETDDTTDTPADEPAVEPADETAQDVVIGTDDTPDVIETDDTPDELAKPDWTVPPTEKQQQWGDQFRQQIAAITAKGGQVSVAKLFPGSREGLALYDAVVKVCGRTGDKRVATPSAAAAVIGVKPADMRRHRKRIIQSIQGLPRK